MKAAFIKERTYNRKIIGRDHGWVLGKISDFDGKVWYPG